MATTPSPARERVLDAYEAQLISEGERAATLENVARAAGVSKGGLLYHFGSKDALAAGLIERLDALVAEDIERMRRAPEGVVEYFVRTSVPIEGDAQSALERAIVACTRLAQGNHHPAGEALRRMQRDWLATIEGAVPDPTVARLIALASDGLYFQSTLRVSDERGDSPAMDELIALLREVIALRA